MYWEGIRPDSCLLNLSALLLGLLQTSGCGQQYYVMLRIGSSKDLSIYGYPLVWHAVAGSAFSFM